MPLQDLNLDDRQFVDLYNEALRRIPAYTPEWTDYNDSDPGITFLQLAAYLQEILIYRLNQVPLKNYQKFMELVGLNLLKSAPAHADLTFTLSKGEVARYFRRNAGCARGRERQRRSSSRPMCR